MSGVDLTPAMRAALLAAVRGETLIISGGPVAYALSISGMARLSWAKDDTYVYEPTENGLAALRAEVSP